MLNLTDDEKEDLNQLKSALKAVYQPLKEFQALVDNNMRPSAELKNKIIIFLEHWMFKEFG